MKMVLHGLENTIFPWTNCYGESGAPSDSGKVTVVMEKLTELLADEEVPCGRLYEMFREMDMGKRTVDRAKLGLHHKPPLKPLC